MEPGSRAMGCPPQSNLVPRHLTPNDGGKHAYLQSGLRVRIRRSLDGLQRRFAPCGTVADQRGSYEINGCGQLDSSPVGLGSSRLAGSLVGKKPGTRGLRLRILQTLLRIPLAALALLVKRRKLGDVVAGVHVSYSGVPHRGGVSAGRPPIACGIKSPTCTPDPRQDFQSPRRGHARAPARERELTSNKQARLLRGAYPP
jgi:hypothetical protein